MCRRRLAPAASAAGKRADRLRAERRDRLVPVPTRGERLVELAVEGQRPLGVDGEVLGALPVREDEPVEVLVRADHQAEHDRQDRQQGDRQDRQGGVRAFGLQKRPNRGEGRAKIVADPGKKQRALFEYCPVISRNFFTASL